MSVENTYKNGQIKSVGSGSSGSAFDAVSWLSETVESCRTYDRAIVTVSVRDLAGAMTEIERLREVLNLRNYEPMSRSATVMPLRPPLDPDHYLSAPMENPEAEKNREIDALRAENEQLKIKLSRMCSDA